MLPIFLAHPLQSAIVLLLLDIAFWRFIPSPLKYWRLAARLVVFLLYSTVLLKSGMSPLKSAPWPEEPLLHLVATGLEIIWWLLGARTLTILINTLFIPEVGKKSRLLTDLLGAVIFLIAVIAATAYVMGLPVKGLLATSGAVAIIMGLALQSTLSDVFSGIVLNTTKPYQLNDWILIDATEGKVVEINWRSTHLLNGVGSLVILPNSLIAKTKIINLSRPSNVHGISIVIEVTPEARPRTVLDALDRAIKGCSELLTTPAASAKLKSAKAISIEYEINGFVRSMDQKTRVCNLLYDLAYRHLAASGVLLHNLSIPMVTHAESTHQKILLDGISIFRTLTDDEKISLSTKMVGHEYPTGAEIIAHGEVTNYLLIVDSGVISVCLATQDGSFIEAGRMGPREVIGESGILKNTPMPAYFRTLTPTMVYRIEKDDLMPFIQARAEVGDALSNLLSLREQTGHTLLAGHEPLPIVQNGFRQWIRRTSSWLKK